MMQRRLDKLINFTDFQNALRIFSKNKDANEFCGMKKGRTNKGRSDLKVKS